MFFLSSIVNIEVTKVHPECFLPLDWMVYWCFHSIFLMHTSCIHPCNGFEILIQRIPFCNAHGSVNVLWSMKFVLCIRDNLYHALTFVGSWSHYPVNVSGNVTSDSKFLPNGRFLNCYKLKHDLDVIVFLFVCFFCTNANNV